MEYNDNSYLEIIKENCTNREFNNLMITMESEKGAEAVQTGVLNSIAKMIFVKINTPDRTSNKDIDIISLTHGDITKLKGFDNTVLVLKALEKSKDARIKEGVSEINTLINNIKKNKDKWMKCEAIRDKADSRDHYILAAIMYRVYITLVKTVVRATSILAAEAMSILKTKPKRIEAIDDVITFNKIYGRGKIDKTLNLIIGKSTVTENIVLGLAIGAALIVALITFFLSIRVFVYYYYYTRMKIADYFEQQSMFLNVHQAELKKNKNLNSAETDAIVKAQATWSKRFMDLSELFVVDDLKVKKIVNKEVKVENSNINPTKIDVPNTGMEFF